MQRIVEKTWRRRASEALSGWVADKRVGSALSRLEVPNDGLGYDRFGIEMEAYRLSIAVYRWLYAHYFRVSSSGLENIPTDRPLIFAPNHAGLIPTGAGMIMADLVCAEPPLMVRPLVGRYLADVPYLNVLLSRTGSVFASAANLDALLRKGQSVLTFPEGSRAIGKPFARRNRLLSFKTFVVDLSLRHEVPIIPVGVVGVEEQAPVITNFEIGRRDSDLPRFPITPMFPLLGVAGLLPLPTKIGIKYGPPLRFYEEVPGPIASPTLVRSFTDQLQSHVQNLVDELREQRQGVFR